MRPFSRIAPWREGERRNNKRHHFVSMTYMNGFLDAVGRVHAYRTDEPSTPLHVPPASIGYKKFYYSQPLPDGTRENHRFEDLWNAVESVWPETMRAVLSHRVSPAVSFNLLGMATIMSTRVQAARERNEVLLATKLRAGALAAEELGLLTPELKRYSGMLDTVPVGINPHETLLAMRADLKLFGDLCFRLGFEVLHNSTGVPFITSDNPVCFYDPDKPAHTRRPYVEGDNIELIFPLDARTMLLGSSRLRPANQVVRHRRLTDAAKVRRINRTVAQFAYRLIVASDRTADALARRYAGLVPTVEVKVRRAGKEVQICVSAPSRDPDRRRGPYLETPDFLASGQEPRRRLGVRDGAGSQSDSLRTPDRLWGPSRKCLTNHTASSGALAPIRDPTRSRFTGMAKMTRKVAVQL